MPQGHILYRWVAGGERNSLQALELESGHWWWRNLPSSRIPPVYYLGPPPGKSVKSWVLRSQRPILYRRVADIEPNKLQEPEL